MALLAVTGVGDPLVYVQAASGAGSTDTVRLQGREMIAFRSTGGAFRVRLKGTGKSSFGNPEPWPYYGQGSAGLNSWLIPAGGQIIVGPFLPYRHNDANGIATIEYLTDPAESALTPNAAFTVAAFRVFPLAL
jgi:hypothetical protein